MTWPFPSFLASKLFQGSHETMSNLCEAPKTEFDKQNLTHHSCCYFPTTPMAPVPTTPVAPGRVPSCSVSPEGPMLGLTPFPPPPLAAPSHPPEPSAAAFPPGLTSAPLSLTETTFPDSPAPGPVPRQDTQHPLHHSPLTARPPHRLEHRSGRRVAPAEGGCRHRQASLLKARSVPLKSSPMAPWRSRFTDVS